MSRPLYRFQAIGEEIYQARCLDRPLTPRNWGPVARLFQHLDALDAGPRCTGIEILTSLVDPQDIYNDEEIRLHLSVSAGDNPRAHIVAADVRLDWRTGLDLHVREFNTDEPDPLPQSCIEEIQAALTASLWEDISDAQI